MRIILLVLFVTFVGYANPYEWIDIYRNGGVKALEKKIDATLKTKEEPASMRSICLRGTFLSALP